MIAFRSEFTFPATSPALSPFYSPKKNASTVGGSDGSGFSASSGGYSTSSGGSATGNIGSATGKIGSATSFGGVSTKNPCATAETQTLFLQFQTESVPSEKDKACPSLHASNKSDKYNKKSKNERTAQDDFNKAGRNDNGNGNGGELTPRGREIARILLQNEWSDNLDCFPQKSTPSHWKNWQYVLLSVGSVAWILFVVIVLRFF